MKKIEGLTKKLKAPNNREEDKNIPTYKDVFVDSLKFSKPKDGKEAIFLNRLADKIFDAGDSVLLEEHEFDILKEKVNDNPCNYFTWVFGQVMEFVSKF